MNNKHLIKLKYTIYSLCCLLEIAATLSCSKAVYNTLQRQNIRYGRAVLIYFEAKYTWIENYLVPCNFIHINDNIKFATLWIVFTFPLEVFYAHCLHHIIILMLPQPNLIFCSMCKVSLAISNVSLILIVTFFCKIVTYISTLELRKAIYN